MDSMDLTFLGLVVAAGFLAGWWLHANRHGGGLGDLSGAVLNASGKYAGALLWVIVVGVWVDDMVKAVRLLG